MRAIGLDGAVGWFHPASGGRGVVIVGAHGYEDMCSRITLRELGDALARAGLPTLRIDPRDTGDSADLPEDADRVATWIADAVAAMRWMREEIGVTEVVLAGLRLGALIAAAAAMEAGDVDRLVLLAPPASGRAYRRELTILSRLIGDMRGGALPDGSIDVAGFRLSAETLRRLETIDLTAPQRAPVKQVLLVGETGPTGATRITSALAAAGSRIETLPFDGYARMMCDPTASEPAFGMVERLVRALAADPPTAVSRPLPPRSATVVGDGWEEERFVFGDGLAGVLCLPTAGPPVRVAIWLNSGRDHHIGWARQAVDLSRRLARSGVAVLRMGLAGTGDSPPHADTPAMAIYHSSGKADVMAAIDEMARRGLSRPWIIGSCSGAYQAFHTAVEDPRIAGIVLINQLCFVWDVSYAARLSAWMRERPQEFEADVQRVEAGEETSAGVPLPRRVWRTLRRWARITFDAARRLRNTGRADRPGQVEAEFRALAARGCAVSIVLSEGDAAVQELELHTGRGGERIAGLPGLEILHIPDADHSLIPAAARDLLGRHLEHRLTGA